MPQPVQKQPNRRTLEICRAHPTYREPMQNDGKQEDEQKADDKDRNTVSDDGQNLYDLIKQGIPFHCTVNSQRNGNGQCENDRKHIDEYGVLQRLLHHIQYRAPINKGFSEVSLQNTAHPFSISNRNGIIQSQIRPQLLIPDLIFMRIQLALHHLQLASGRIPRDHIIQGKQNKGHNKKNKYHIQDSFYNILPHCKSLPPISMILKRFFPIKAQTNRKMNTGNRVLMPIPYFQRLWEINTCLPILIPRGHRAGHPPVPLSRSFRNPSASQHRSHDRYWSTAEYPASVHSIFE